MLSVLDLFRIGIGPSSSHTVGPMRVTRRFVETLRARRIFGETARVEIELQGSLALTGIGHGTPKAALLGLAGQDPETVDPAAAEERLIMIEQAGLIGFDDRPPLTFNAERDIVFAFDTIPELHPNGMRLRAWNAQGTLQADETWYSIGGGFIADAAQLREGTPPSDLTGSDEDGALAFGSAAQLLALCDRLKRPISAIVLANEEAHRPASETEARLDLIVAAMNGCINRGLHVDGILPGGLNVRRRAPALWRKLDISSRSNEQESLLDWLNVYALAVSEENAAGGRVVTAPTNGAAGIIPSVMRHYCVGARPCREFLLTAGGIGMLYKQRASISGAEMGCQGEVGVAASMAAAGLAAIWGGTPLQVTTAAEIAMEHNLGLTCDPVRGLVQIPCIERNAIGAVKAVNAARLALHSDDRPRVSLDEVIETMRQTGQDMCSKYKETSQGGLAVHVVEC